MMGTRPQTTMQELGEPVRRWEVIPLSEPVRPTKEPATPSPVPEKAPEREREPA